MSDWAIVGLTFALVAVTTYYAKRTSDMVTEMQRTREASLQQYVDAVWGSILNTAAERPQLCDISITENYLAEMSWQDRLAYDAFCLQGWSTLHEASDRNLLKEHRLELAFKWMCAFHDTWLTTNAHLFRSEEFWAAVTTLRKEEAAVLRHRPVPADLGHANWDTLSGRYFQTVLSPFDPTIAVPNSLTEAILRAVQKKQGENTSLTILDVGCGPGNLLTLLENAFASEDIQMHYIGVDYSAAAVELAKQRLGTSSLRGEIIHTDLLDRNLHVRGDVVVCINAILGSSRQHNVDLLKRLVAVSRSTRTDIICLLPAFEAFEHIAQLRERSYARKFGAEQGQRAVESLVHLKAPDPQSASYSDDGRTRQYFHSLDTIRRETELAGLVIVNGPQKFYYPWSLARRFDYGYFPGEEPVWDWLLVCRPRN